jgi:hypothetical protein
VRFAAGIRASVVRLALLATAVVLVLPLSVPPAFGSEESTLGVHRQGTFYLQQGAREGAADHVVAYGRASDLPLLGDWNGDGTTTVGVRRGNRFLLRNSNTSGVAALDFQFGRAGDQAISGDWNGDGTTTVGIRRGDRFLLRNSNSAGWAHLDFRFGRSDDEVVVGDWNGDGTTTVGVRRGNRFLLRNDNSAGWADLDLRYGRSSDIPLPGAWLAPPEPDPEPEPRVVASFTTPLTPGQPRNTNIHQASDYIDGSVIRPGQRFSLNEAIGRRTRERGFVENGYIDDGQVRSTVGGGVSQVATTFLNAAWFAGIDLIDFRQHTIYFERYPMCREATLAWDVLDVVVRNDSPHPITVQTSYTDSWVRVELVSLPWADVSSWTGQPYNVEGPGGAFSVRCGRTVTYPDGRTAQDAYTWRYNQGYPG